MSLVEKVITAVAAKLPDPPADPLIGAERVVGRALPRRDGAQKVSGAARFTAEFHPPGLAYASLVCSTIARGSVAAVDAAEAQRAPGVLAVITHANAPRMAAPPMMMSDPDGAAMSNLPVLQDATVRWNGQPVAVVVAGTQLQADHAASLVRVTYQEEPATLSFEKAKPFARTPPKVMREPNEVAIGDAEAALRAAAVQVDAVYTTPRYTHNALELHVTTAQWLSDDELVVHDASQSLMPTRHTLAKALGLRDRQVRVLAPFVGGAFGNKGVWNHTLLACAAAKATGRPVRLALTREQVFRVVGGRTLSEQRVALGARADGRLDALIHTGTTAVVDHNLFPEQFSFPARHLYAADALLVRQHVVDLDMVANTAMRAPGESIGTFALESAIDELAVACALDPVELRRRLEPARDPSSGKDFSSRHVVEAFRRGAERFGWPAQRPAPRTQRDGDWWVGQGVAMATYPYYRMPGASARIRLHADGRAVVQASAHEMGMGTATVQAQHAAERLGLAYEDVTFEYGDTDLPPSPIAGGSAQTASILAAVTAASERLVEQMLAYVRSGSPLWGARPDDVRAHDGGLWRLDDPTKGETYAAILARVDRDVVEVKADAAPPLEVAKYSMHSYGAQFCEVRVHAATGEVRVARWLGSFDTGRILNPRTARSQFRGGIIMGIGMALMEESQFDERSGRFMNASLADYHVPVHADVPAIDVIWTDRPDPHTPLGVHGIGEIGITGCAAAIANAVHHAVGVRVRSLPITLDKLLPAL